MRDGHGLSGIGPDRRLEGLERRVTLRPGAEGLDDYHVAMRWFESRLSATPELRPVLKHYFSNVLGGLFLRAGRIDEAITRINEGMAAAKEVEIPTDWAYLSLAHAR